jgi:pSer/pThr/pTyr-binding forkhead associated (FHA) protein
MISIKCPHCRVGLKIDETKIPEGILSFKCPKCKKEIPISYIEHKLEDNNTETVVLPAKNKSERIGKLTVQSNQDTLQQEFQLEEGDNIIGRKAKATSASICIVTNDKTVSRSHLKIVVKKRPKGGYIHCLSDNNSINHTLYNGKNLESGDIVVLKDNDEIIVGSTTIRFTE